MYDGLHFELDERKYLLGKTLGSGSYGVVVKAFDRLTKQNVAVKQIPRLYDEPDTTKKIMREIRVLQSLRACEYIISLLDVELSGTSMYMITELCETDLNALIQNDVVMAKLDSQKYLSIMWQILHAVSFMHSVGVLHRDIKPANILLDASLTVRLCDFGLARVSANSEIFVDPACPDMTEYVVSRWYRAPEVVLVPGRYGKMQDVWSCGCSFAEFIRRKALFPGSSVVNQVHVIVDILGKPTQEEMDFDMSDRSRRYMNNIQSMSIGLETVMKPPSDLIHKDLFSLINSMLTFDPRRRISSHDALSHPVFDDFASIDMTSLTKTISIDLEPIDNCDSETTAYVNMMRYVVRDVRQELRKFPFSLKKSSSRTTESNYFTEMKLSPSQADLATLNVAADAASAVENGTRPRSRPETESRTPPPVTVPVTQRPAIVQRVIERRRSALNINEKKVDVISKAVVTGSGTIEKKSLNRAFSRDTLTKNEADLKKPTFDIPQPPSSLPTLKKTIRPQPGKVITRRQSSGPSVAVSSTAPVKGVVPKFDPNASFHILASIKETDGSKIATAPKTPLLATSASPRGRGAVPVVGDDSRPGDRSPRRTMSPRRSSRLPSPRNGSRANQLPGSENYSATLSSKGRSTVGGIQSSGSGLSTSGNDSPTTPMNVSIGGLSAGASSPVARALVPGNSVRNLLSVPSAKSILTATSTVAPVGKGLRKSRSKQVLS